MLKFGHSILKTDYIKKEGFRKEIMVSTIVSLTLILLLVVMAAVFDKNAVVDTDVKNIYGEWKPKAMFVGNTVLGSAQPLRITDSELELGKKKYKVNSAKYETKLENGAIVFILNVVEEGKPDSQKEFPFILLEDKSSILQLGKIGMSYIK